MILTREIAVRCWYIRDGSFWKGKFRMMAGYSRNEFLRLCAGGVGVAALGTAAETDADSRYDFRDFVNWIRFEFEPSIRLPGGAGRYPRKVGQTELALYGVADMACSLYTIGALHPSRSERAQWADAFDLFQIPETGWFLEKEPRTLSPQHNTAFALGAMELLEISPRFEVKPQSEYSNIRAYLATLNWRTGVYSDSHKGAGVGSVYALVPTLRSTEWFHEYFATCDSLFDRNNGLMGQGKPAAGDSDQIGGTFHYSFLYQYFNLRMPFPEKRIDTILRLQQPDGYWSKDNHLWLTLDAIYLMTRTLRHTEYRAGDVRACLRRTLTALEKDVYAPAARKQMFSTDGGVHLLTAAISIVAEAQQFLGRQEVVTDWPLKLVLDRRPFI